jgi:hypothetical protein
MSSVGRPVHGVDLGKMALECALGLHGKARQGLDAVAGDIADCMQLLASQHRGWRCSAVRCDAVGRGAAPAPAPAPVLHLHARDVRVVSASSSFFRFILSFRASASRRAT